MEYFAHRWDDVSHHGSPTYQCDFCRAMKHDPEAKLPCPKAEKALKKEANDKLMKEKYEWERLKAEVERFEYLKNKFEPDYNKGWIDIIN